MPLHSHPKRSQVTRALRPSLVSKAQYNLYVVNMNHLIRTASRVQFANMNIFEEGKARITLYAENTLTVLFIHS